MIKLKIDKRVYWTDPDNFNPGIYIVVSIDEKDVRYCTVSRYGKEYKARVVDLIDLSDVYCCSMCGDTNVKLSVWYNPNLQEVIFDQDITEYRCAKCKKKYPGGPVYLSTYKRNQKQ